MELAPVHRTLLERVADQLSKTSSSTDHLLLTRWRVLGLCQHLVAWPDSTNPAVVAALQSFASHGAGGATDEAIRVAVASLNRDAPETSRSILPMISGATAAAVVAELEDLARLGDAAVEQALAAIPDLQMRIEQASGGLPWRGIRHRLDLIAAIAGDVMRPPSERSRAAAAILYVKKIVDAIPDTLGITGLLDDDYALQVALQKLGVARTGAHLHWSERISLLWDDLPYLRGVDLQKSGSPIATTWLDRLNSYVSYLHVIAHDQRMLILLQPSVASSPLHPLLTLLGLLVLDGLTSSVAKARELRSDHVYEIDGRLRVRFEGIAGPELAAWLRLRLRDGVIYLPPATADRMILTVGGRLSSAREYSSHAKSRGAGPIQRFFDWDEAISASSISGRLIFVTSRLRALELFEGVQSNGVGLLDHGLISFTVGRLEDGEPTGNLILVVPSLAAVRLLLQRGVQVLAIFIDGYDRLHHGRHDLPFITTSEGTPPIIVWSPAGYFAVQPPTWLPAHTLAGVSTDDLALVLELDGDIERRMAPGRASLWEAATAPGMEMRRITTPPHEGEVAEAVQSYREAVRGSVGLPEHWRYHLSRFSRTLGLLTAATPADWADIKEFVRFWEVTADERWSMLRPRAAEELGQLRQLERAIYLTIGSVTAEANSKGEALKGFLAERRVDGVLQLPCDRPEQAKAAWRFVRRLGMTSVQPVLLRDLEVCSWCVVTGWSGSSFANRLRAHTPRSLTALVSESESRSWENAAATGERHAKSLLEIVGHPGRPTPPRPAETPELKLAVQRPSPSGEPTDHVPCVFLWLDGESDGKVLSRSSRVVVEDANLACERAASRLKPDDRVIIGSGADSWSPAEEFTQSVVEAVEASNADLVHTAREWRRSLRKFQERHGLAASELRARLAAVGISRELQTIEGWLKVERAAPIGPLRLGRELASIWSLVGSCADRTLESVAAACIRLRSLRSAAGRALLKLWKGRTVELGIPEELLDELVQRLKQELRVREVASITFGDVPVGMLGWWVSQDVAAQFETDADRQEAGLLSSINLEGEEGD